MKEFEDFKEFAKCYNSKSESPFEIREMTGESFVRLQRIVGDRVIGEEMTTDESYTAFQVCKDCAREKIDDAYERKEKLGKGRFL